MRIVHVTDCFLPMMGGIETQVSQLARQQVRLGYEVVVLTCTEDDKGIDANLPYRVLRSIWNNPLQAPVDFRAPRRFAEFILTWRPQVVHLHLGEVTPGVQGLLWKLRAGTVPVVVTVHSVWSQTFTQPVYRALGRRLHASPVAWTGVSELVSSRLADIVGAENVRVLPNGVDGKFWSVEPESHEGLTAVTASRFAPRKRIGALLEILAGAASNLPPGALRAVLAGDGPGLEKARRYVNDQGLSEAVLLPGRLTAEQLKSLYAEADVFLSPSVSEAASVAAAEAQAAGLAILARRQSGLGERISPAEGAAVDTDEEFQATITRWATDPEQVKTIKEHNRTTVCPLDWTVVLPQVADIYAWAARRAENEKS